MKHLFRSLALCASLTAVMLPAAAQQTQEKAAGPLKGMAEGVLAGQMAAEKVGTGGSFTGGLVGGLLGGLIGTGIAWAVQGPSDLPVFESAEAQKYGTEYVMGFQQGFSEKSKKKKRGAALTGGLIGTGVLVMLVATSSGN